MCVDIFIVRERDESFDSIEDCSFDSLHRCNEGSERKKKKNVRVSNFDMDINRVINLFSRVFTCMFVFLSFLYFCLFFVCFPFFLYTSHACQKRYILFN